MASLWRSWPASGEAILKFRGSSQPSDFPAQPETIIPISPQLVRAQLEKICATEEFQRSKRSRKFLSYIVEETLAGRSGRIKAYSVAISVLDRDETFDPQTDPMVRIEASQLRRRLERYYLTRGAHDPIIIDLPKGGYVPVFSTARHIVAAHTAAPPRRAVTYRRMMVAVLGMAFMAAPLIALAFRPSPDRSHIFASAARANPTIQVLPFSAVTSDNRSVTIAAGLADEVTQVLTQHGNLSVLAGREKVRRRIAQLRRYVPDRKCPVECRDDPPYGESFGCAYGDVRLG